MDDTQQTSCGVMEVWDNCSTGKFIFKSGAGPRTSNRRNTLMQFLELSPENFIGTNTSTGAGS